MTLYAGERTMDGAIVTRDGAPLNPRHDVANFSRVGLEWGFDGGPARQLALALLCDYLGDAARAIRLAPLLAEQATARLPNEWSFDDVALGRLVAELDPGGSRS